jgi:hypothetical protein
VAEAKEAPADERPTKWKKVEQAITDGEKAFEGAAKNLVVAYNHGWEVVRGLQGAAYAQTEDEQKKLKAAIKAAELVTKAGKGKVKNKQRSGGAGASTSGGGGSSYPQQAQGAGVGARRGPQAQTPATPVVSYCYSCGGAGHFAKYCPGKK